MGAELFRAPGATDKKFLLAPRPVLDAMRVRENCLFVPFITIRRCQTGAGTSMGNSDPCELALTQAATSVCSAPLIQKP